MFNINKTGFIGIVLIILLGFLGIGLFLTGIPQQIGKTSLNELLVMASPTPYQFDRIYHPDELVPNINISPIPTINYNQNLSPQTPSIISIPTQTSKPIMTVTPSPVQSNLSHTPPSNSQIYTSTHFNLYTDAGSFIANEQLKFAEAFRTYVSINLFEIPEQKINFFYFNNPNEFLASKICASTFGCYYDDDKLAITHSQSGYGTVTHELMHAFMHPVFNQAPPWFWEGLSTLVEKIYGYYGSDGSLTAVVGFQNPWRVESFITDIVGSRNYRPEIAHILYKNYPYQDLIDYSQTIDRMLAIYLHQRGWFTNYIHEIQYRFDPNLSATLVKVTEKSMSDLESDWQSWINELVASYQQPESYIQNIPVSTIYANKTMFDQWWNSNKYNLGLPENIFNSIN